MADIIKDELLGEIECVDGFETEVNWVNNKKIDVYFDISDYQLLNEKDEEKTDKEKRTPVTYLVQAASLDKARAYVKEVMEKALIDYDVISISETHFIDVFEHNNQ